jgi:hypothetical protein
VRANRDRLGTRQRAGFLTTTGDCADDSATCFTGIGGVQHDHGIHAFIFGPDGSYQLRQ